MVGDLKRLMANREIDEEGCWIWTGKKNDKGYGLFDGYGIKVHIVAFEIFHGERTPGLEIMHKCDKRACFRPDCLSEGTHAQNMKDAASRGRMSPAKITNVLTYEKAEEIRERVDEGESYKDLAQEFGVDPAHISHIITNKKWKRRV